MTALPIFKEKTMRMMLPLLFVVALGGCATGAKQNLATDARAVDIKAKLSLSGCAPDMADQVLDLRNPALEQEAAFRCLQDGQLTTVERLLTGYRDRHDNPPNPDYSEYLLALTDFVRFELAEGDAASQLKAGRKSHDQLVAFVRNYPESAYRNEVAPRLETLHEGMARAEYRLAMTDIEKGRREMGASRLRYVAREYPRSAAAVDARRWLEQRLAP